MADPARDIRVGAVEPVKPGEHTSAAISSLLKAGGRGREVAAATRGPTNCATSPAGIRWPVFGPLSPPGCSDLLLDA